MPTIERSFCDLSAAEGDLLAFDQGLQTILPSQQFGWETLSRFPRVLLISEAGSGKTYECQTRAQRLWDLGKPSFYIELSSLAQGSLQDQFTTVQGQRFDQWLAQSNQSATFFLDAIDELKLTQTTLRAALIKFERGIRGHLDCVNLIITSRPTAFDLELIKGLFPVASNGNRDKQSLDFARQAMGDAIEEPDSEIAAPRWRQIHLVPLTEPQVLQLAQFHGAVDNAEDLMQALREQDAWTLAERPLDVLQICDLWKSQGRIGSYSDQIKQSCESKLQPRADRPEKSDLSAERARSGAMRLALACLLSKKLRLRYHLEAHQQQDTPALDPARILSDWSQPELETLLERPLFRFASYGQVDFHHRSAIEYLAAEQLRAMRRQGMPYKALKRILFTQALDASLVVKPSLRAVAAWLAPDHDVIFNTLLTCEPELLLAQADPAALSSSQRSTVLEAFVSQYGTGGWRGLTVPSVQAHRFATPALSPTIHRLWSGGIDNIESRQILLELIGAGRMQDCVELVFETLTQPDLPESERLSALDALILLEDNRLTGIVDEMLTPSTRWSHRMRKAAVLRLFPRQMAVDQALEILCMLLEDEQRLETLSMTWGYALSADEISLSVLDDLRHRLTELLKHDLAWRSDTWPSITVAYPDLLPPLAAVCLRQLKTQRNSAPHALVESTALALSQADGADGRFMTDLTAWVNEAPGPIRSRLFWAIDRLQQRLKGPTTTVVDRFFSIHRTLQGFFLNADRDRSWIIVTLADKNNPLVDRELMLEAALHLGVYSSSGSAQQCSDLRVHVADSPALVKRLNAAENPPAPTPEQLALKVESEQRRAAHQRQKAEQRSVWTRFRAAVIANPDAHFSKEHQERTVYNLWQAMVASHAGRGSGGWNRTFIEAHFGSEIADRLRHGLMAIWRRYEPTLAHERAQAEKNSHLVIWDFGLAGIAAEAEHPDWAVQLSLAEAQLAARYVPVELNAFPFWLEDLVEAHQDAVDTVLGKAYAAELSDIEDGSQRPIFLQHLRNASAVVKAWLIPRLLAYFEDCQAHLLIGQAGAVSEARLFDVTAALIRDGDTTVRNRVADVAVRELEHGINAPFAKVWLPALMTLNPMAATTFLERELESATPAREGAGAGWIARLFCQLRSFDSMIVNPRDECFTPNCLLRLVRLAYRHVHPEDDVSHVGVYTPGLRDDAESGRDALLQALINTNGPEGWQAKQELAGDPLMSHFKDRALTLAREKAAEEADVTALTEDAVREMMQRLEAPPATNADMFQLMMDRLVDLDELLASDTSPRELWAGITSERVMRREIADRLQQSANGLYIVDQECVTGDEKETDLRLRAVGSELEAVIELKIGGNGYSGKDLRNTLDQQLIKKYLQPQTRRAGCLLVTVADANKRWEHPESKARLDAEGLQEMLRQEAVRLVERSDSIAEALHLDARIVDLRAR